MYSALTPPSDPAAIPSFLARELRAVQDGIGAPDLLKLKELHASPARPQTGMIVLADGSDWDPGSGAGFYGYYGSAWHKLG